MKARGGMIPDPSASLSGELPFKKPYEIRDEKCGRITARCKALIFLEFTLFVSRRRWKMSHLAATNINT